MLCGFSKNGFSVFQSVAFPGEIVEEGGAVFDAFCTDADGSKFIIEIQRGYQEHFKERALTNTSAVPRKNFRISINAVMI